MESVAELVAAQVARTPHATAVIDRARTLSYAELDTRANHLAGALVSRGASVGTRVGVCCERSADMIVAVLGIVKAGAAYVPIDPDYPAARRELIATDAKLSAVVTQQTLARRFAVPAICVDAIAPHAELPRVEIRGDDAFYVLYTSGSTGQPKGVVGLHGAVASRLRWQQDVYPFAPGEIASARTTLGFVDSIAEIFAPLAFGVPLFVIGGAAQRDATAQIDELADAGATRIVLVPSLLATMLDVMPDLAARAPKLHYWFVGGEPVPVPLVERFRRALPGRKLINIYGATELTADATYYDFDAMPDGLATSPIGVPLPGVHARILDADLREVADGESGEVCISGVCLTRGYLDRPDLTAERFVPNPFPEGGRLYRTRDLGRRLPTGDIQYLGRLDQLVKIRGFRVELGEVEAVVGAAPGVAHAVAVARGDQSSAPPFGGAARSGEAGPFDQLVAFYSADRELPACELRAFVAARVPEQAVPNRFVHVEQFPINANGKVDRAALASVAIAIDPGAPPATDDERRVAAVWSAILGEPAVGRAHDFFELGGTSLAAMRIAAKLRELYGAHVPVATVFAHPTVAALAAELSRATPVAARRAIVVTGRPLPRSLPLSRYQFPFWMFRALTGGVSVVADAFAFAGPIDVERLQMAFSRTVARFDALWMRYPRFRPAQQLAPRAPCRFEVRPAGDVEREAALNNARTFDLMAPPHVHARLVGDRLLVAMPHVAVDMAAMELFRATLEAYYTGRTPPALGASLYDLIEWERSLGDVVDDVAYWRGITAGSAANPLPARLFARGRERAWSTRAIDAALLARVRTFARRHAISLPLALVGAIYAALARVAEIDDPTLLVMIEKRDRAELRGLFANLTAVMPCRIDRGRAPAADVAARVAQQLVASSEHTDHLMQRPTMWNDFWTRAPRFPRWLVERAAPARVAEYVFALVPAFERRPDARIFAVNILPEVAQPGDDAQITRRRALPDMLVPTDLVTGADALLARTLQIHVTNAGEIAINLYGGGVSQRGLDEIADRIVTALGELA